MSQHHRKKSPALRPTGDSTSVEDFLASLEHPQKPAILALRALILSVDPRVTEGIKWNAPSFRTSDDFATFHLRAKAGVQLVLHFGAAPRRNSAARARIADPAGLLEWKAPDRAVITVRDAEDVAARRAALLAVLRQWVQHV